MELNLKANTPSEQKILEYLQNNASETLAEKINNGTPFEKDGEPLINKKTLAGFMKYACEEARKTVESGSSSACIEDSVVYGWAVHYFEEESIEGTLYTLDGEEYKPRLRSGQSQTGAVYCQQGALHGVRRRERRRQDVGGAGEGGGRRAEMGRDKDTHCAKDLSRS